MINHPNKRIGLQQSLPALLVAAVFCGIATGSFAAETGAKGGVTPQAISLPSGPGSIEGLGESYEPRPSTGTGSYSLPLSLPALGSAAPGLVLVYDSGFGNGWLGRGWQMRTDFIRRQSEFGVPLFDETDQFAFNGTDDLLHVADDDCYRMANESAFQRYVRLPDGSWLAQAPDGTRTYYGGTPDSRWVGLNGNTFQWHVSKVRSPNGFVTEFTYNVESGIPRIAAVRYGRHESNAQGGFLLSFDYEDRPDPISFCRSGVVQVYGKRLVLISLRLGDQLVRRWKLKYHPGSPSLLAEVSVYGDARCADNDSALVNKDFLPPARFDYTPALDTASAVTVNVQGIESLVLHDGDAELIDLDANGLPDLLRYQNGEYSSALNIDGVSFAPWALLRNPPAALLREDNSVLADTLGGGRCAFVYTVNGTFFHSRFLSPTLMADREEFSVPGSFDLSDSDVRVVDITGDGAVDFVSTRSFGFGVMVNGRGEEPSYELWREAAPDGARFRYGWQLADMNGDGLQDLVTPRLADSGGMSVALGLGWGAFAETYTMKGGPTAEEIGYDGVSRLYLADINRDGLSDLVYVNWGCVTMWLNVNGTGFAAPQTITEGVPPYNSGTVAVRFADMNGNGSIDVVWNTIDESHGYLLKYLDLMPGVRPYQLNLIENGIGRTVAIEYASSIDLMIADAANGKPWELTPPFPVDVVQRYTVFDGTGAATETLVAYRDCYFSVDDNQFRGFRIAVRRVLGDVSMPTLETEHGFHLGEEFACLAGKPIYLEYRDPAAGVFYRETNVWQVRELARGEGLDPDTVTTAYLTERTRRVIEQGTGAPVDLKWEYAYDDYGNVTNQVEHGRLDGAWDDERVTRRTFTAQYPAGLTNWILNLPVEEDITDENGVRSAAAKHFYDGFTTLGEVTRGNLTRKDAWVTGDRWIAQSRTAYDAFGNPVMLYDPLYDPAQPASGHFREVVYDDVLHAFPVTEHIHTGNPACPVLTMSATYDYGFGVLTKSTEFNGHDTSYGYDPFGRLTSITKPGDTPASPTEAYGYMLAHALPDGSVINWVETRKKDDLPGGPVPGYLCSRNYFDGLGRKIMTRAEGEHGGQVVVSDTVRFNARQQPWKKYLPYFDDPSTLDYVSPAFTNGFTEHIYDALGREVRMNQPEGPDGIAFATTDYLPMGRLVHDEEQTNPSSKHFGCGMRYIEDGLLDDKGKGRLREVYELVKLTNTGDEGPLTEWKTQYRYDVLGNFTGYTDSQNNRKYVHYDGLSRKTFMNDPDRSWMWWAYDDAGNVIRTRDAKFQEIAYEYDGVNRILNEYYCTTNENAGAALVAPVPGVSAYSTPWNVQADTLPNRPAEIRYHYDTPYGPLTRGHLWNPPVPASALAVLGQTNVTAEADVNNDHVVDVADVVSELKNDPAALAERAPVTAENTLGSLAWVEDLSGKEHQSFDKRGRSEWIVKQIADQNYFSEMRYDAADRVKSRTHPDGSRIDYAYNTRGLLESMPGYVGQIDYNPAGQNSSLVLNAGIERELSFDHRLRLQQLSSIRQSDSLAIETMEYEYDNASNITAIRDQRTPTQMIALAEELKAISMIDQLSREKDFAYDSRYRLVQAQHATAFGTIGYRYDRIGNMVNKAAQLVHADPVMNPGGMNAGGVLGSSGRNGRSAGEVPGPHAVKGIENNPGETLDYDANGNMRSDGGMALQWDARDRLIRLSKEDAATEYLYDYTGARKIKLEAGADSKTIYISPYCEVRDGDFVKYVYAGNSRVAKISKAGTHYFLHDHLGSVGFVLNIDGRVNDQMDSYPFGRQRISTGSKALADYTFTGKENDTESGLHYFEARYLASHLGRFNRVDPLAESMPEEWFTNPQQLNLYAYGLNNPVNSIDPSGMAVDAHQRTTLFMDNNSSQYDVNHQNDSYKHIGLMAGGASLRGGMSGEVAGIFTWFNIGKETHDVFVGKMQFGEYALNRAVDISSIAFGPAGYAVSVSSFIAEKARDQFNQTSFAQYMRTTDDKQILNDILDGTISKRYGSSVASFMYVGESVDGRSYRTVGDIRKELQIKYEGPLGIK